ncbi:hypothetical protein HR12_27275 [Microbacterium sp. SUBG005]|nr:hypothetical protein HR12_27275 [Microbacterium sp. SUBG005]
MRDTAKTVPWEMGDALAVGGTRWKIVALNSRTRAVQLEALSTTNHGMRWTTKLSKLPRKAAR